jgi:hypothetical protein
MNTPLAPRLWRPTGVGLYDTDAGVALTSPK